MRGIILTLVCVFFFSCCIADGTEKKVFVVTIDGSINPSTSDVLTKAVQKVSLEHGSCLLVKLNTPGGLLKSTRVIVSEFLMSPVPIVVYVSPGGAQAASAGVFITLSAHLAVMAPGTNIGAAHPVGLNQQEDSIMMQKVTNDAAAFIRTISEKRHRNISWAEESVRKSISITETEALKLHVIDTIANNDAELLRLIDGKAIETSAGTTILKTREAEIIQIEISFFQKMLDLISDPNIAYILMMLGFYGLLFELYNPGSILPGIVGGICLILAFYSLHTLPINYAGLALVIFAIVLFVLEVKIISHGLLTIGGVISLVLGSLMLIQADTFFDVLTISWKVILIVAALTVAFFAFAIGLGIKAQRKQPTTGREGIIGKSGEALTDLSPTGQVSVHGEIWNATSIEGLIQKGNSITVESINNLTLNVRKHSL